MAKKFKKGDPVILKSGGPVMTVSKYESYSAFGQSNQSNDMVVCTWLDKTDNLVEGTFDQQTLKPVVLPYTRVFIV